MYYRSTAEGEPHEHGHLVAIGSTSTTCSEANPKEPGLVALAMHVNTQRRRRPMGLD
jgi:hypothetical protein